ncbi:MAG: phage tail sheath family protein [Terriglobia bacterium]
MGSFPVTDKAPGVYIQEITLPGPIPGVSTSIAAFVGPAQSGPLLTPTMLTQMSQFTDVFGSYIEVPYRVYVTHAVNGFFNEGGQQCYFVRVGNGKQASLKLPDQANLVVTTNPQQPTLVVTAQQEGTAANSISAKVDPASIASASVVSAETTLSAAAAAGAVSATVASASGFMPGDTVTLAQGPTTENATIQSLNATAKTISFQSGLANAYPSGATLRIADLTVGQQQIRVTSVTGFEPGSYVTVGNGTAPNSYDVVRVVNQTTGVLTITNGLTSAYSMAQGAAAVKVASMEFTLTVVSPTAGTETFPNLAMDSRHSRYFGNIVNSGAIDLTLADPPSTTPPPLNLPAKLDPAQSLTGGANDNLSTLATTDYHNGIDALKKCDDVNLICVPDAVTTSPSANSHFQVADTQDVQAYTVAHCEQMQDRFAILDSSQYSQTDVTFNAIQSQRQSVNSNNGYGALYFPWIGISSPFGSGQILVPPSGHISGVYANNDNTYGVYEAPANEPITSALSLDLTLSNDEQGPLNEQGINAIRSFTSAGILIWGARTISPPDMTAWRYINVRRLMLYIEKSIQEGTQFAVFKPNNITLWQQVKRLVTDFLTPLWQEGALFGATADQAFRVRVDATLNTPQVVALGQLIVQVTVVPTHPAEFIIFQVIQDPTGASLQESTA